MSAKLLQVPFTTHLQYTKLWITLSSFVLGSLQH